MIVVLWLNGAHAHLLCGNIRERERERVQIPARSEKTVVVQLKENVHMANGLNILVDPMNVFVNDD